MRDREQITERTGGKSEMMVLAASRLFARHSYAKVTMEQIAAELRMVPGALYHYFPDKEALIFSCYMHGISIYAGELTAACEAGLDGLETVRRFVRGRLRPDGPRMILFTDIDALSEQNRRLVHQGRRANAEALAAVIERGVIDGSIRSDDSLITAIGLFSVLDWIPFWFSENDFYGRQDAIEAIDDILTHGVYRRDLPRVPLPPVPDLAPILDRRSKLGKRAARLDSLLKAATDSFNKKGALGASLEGIAADAGITRAGIYYHFKDKEELLYHCLKRGLELEIAAGINIAAQGAEDAVFEIQITRSLFMLHSTLSGPKTTYHNISYLDDEHRSEFLANVQDTIAMDRQRYQKWIDAGRFRNVDTYFAQQVKTGMHHWYPIWFGDHIDWSPTTIADHFSEIFLYGLKAQTGEISHVALSSPDAE